MLGVYAMEDVLRMLRRRGICPERWNRDRQPVGSRPQAATDDCDDAAALPVPALSSSSPAGGPGTEMAIAVGHGPGGAAGE